MEYTETRIRGIFQELVDTAGAQPPRWVYMAVTSLLRDSEDHSLVATSEDKDGTTTWTVLGMVKPAALLTVTASRDEANWHLENDPNGSQPASFDAALRAVSDVRAVRLTAVDFDGGAWGHAHAWRPTWEIVFSDGGAIRVPEPTRRAAQDKHQQIVDALLDAVSG